jgi:hypothetical protein
MLVTHKNIESDIDGNKQEKATKECDHSHLGLIKEENKQWATKLKEDGKLCDVCDKLIEKPFYRCITCSFEYVCCPECYGNKLANDNSKRVAKRKILD